MKLLRHNKILEIIKNNEIETQDDLVLMLKNAGFKVTQATISRDIKELSLVKTQTKYGKYKYSVNISKQSKDIDVFIRIFKETVLSIDYSLSLIVVKTMQGSANAVAEAIDNLNFEGIMGSIAGDNTIFVATTSEAISGDIADKFKDMLK